MYIGPFSPSTYNIGVLHIGTNATRKVQRTCQKLPTLLPVTVSLPTFSKLSCARTEAGKVKERAGVG